MVDASIFRLKDVFGITGLTMAALNGLNYVSVSVIRMMVLGSHISFMIY